MLNSLTRMKLKFLSNHPKKDRSRDNYRDNGKKTGGKSDYFKYESDRE